MHTRASNSELVEPLPEPERTLNRRLRRQNRRVPFDQRNNPPQHPRFVYPPILDINYFRHFLITLQNLYPMDDKPMWAVDRVVALTPGSAITILETETNLPLKHKDFQSRSKQSNLDDDDIPMSCEEEAKFMQTFRPAFLSDEGSAILQNQVPLKLGDPRSFLIPCHFNKAFSYNALADLGASINPMLYSLYAKLSLETLKPTQMSVRLADRSFQYPIGIAENMLVEVGKFTFPADFVILEMEEDSKVPLILGRPFLHTADAVIRVKQKQLNLGVGTERMIFHIDSAMKHSYSNDDTCFSIDVIDEILEEDFDALLDEGSEILYSIEGTILEEKLFAEFDEFMPMTTEENFESESDTEEPPFEKITFHTDYKIKTSLEEPPTDLELKPLPDNLEYVFLEEPSFLSIIISSQLSEENKNKLISVLKRHKQAFSLKTTNIPRICPSFFEVFMDDFSVFGSSFDHCLNNLDKMLQRCKDAHLVLNWKKCHFMVKEGIVLGHKVSEAGLKVDKAKIDVISKLSPPTNIKEFYIEIKDRKGTKNVAADHLYRIENDKTSDDSEADDNFPGKTLMEVNTEDEPCYHIEGNVQLKYGGEPNRKN
ncbi:reverse transcriptase domain-containing protein [Tanacetum coccineum]